MAETSNQNRRNDQGSGAVAQNGADAEQRSGGESGQVGGADRMNPIQWHVIVPIILIGAVVLLFGLPIGAVWVVNSSGCCLANGTESLVTFWASLSAGFLALFGMVVTGVFIVTAFRVNAEARAEARTSAQKEAEKVARTYSSVTRESCLRRWNRRRTRSKNVQMRPKERSTQLGTMPRGTSKQPLRAPRKSFSIP